MTFEEGRALFPVLQRLAYLNAGTNGPYATPTVEAVRAELDRQLAEGRSGEGFLERAAKYLEVGVADIGPLSLAAGTPQAISSVRGAVRARHGAAAL